MVLVEVNQKKELVALYPLQEVCEGLSDVMKEENTAFQQNEETDWRAQLIVEKEQMMKGGYKAIEGLAASACTLDSAENSSYSVASQID